MACETPALKPKGLLEGWCNTLDQFSAELGEEGLRFLIRLGLGEEKIHPGSLAAGGISTLHAGLCPHGAREGAGAARATGAVVGTGSAPHLIQSED